VQINIKTFFAFSSRTKSLCLRKNEENMFSCCHKGFGEMTKNMKFFFSEVTSLQSFVWLVTGKLAPLAFLLAQRFVFWLVQIFLDQLVRTFPHLYSSPPPSHESSVDCSVSGGVGAVSATLR
jgi:hypothetical protein